MFTNGTKLKIKNKSLAEESRIIRKEERESRNVSNTLKIRPLRTSSSGDCMPYRIIESGMFGASQEQLV